MSRIPRGYHALTPQLAVRDAEKAIAFYEDVFGAEVLGEPIRSMDGKRIVHAVLRIGDSILFLADEDPGAYLHAPDPRGGTTEAIQLYVKDAKKLFRKAEKAGANVLEELHLAFWGDLYGRVVDPFGHAWAIAERVKSVTPRQMRKAAERMMKQAAQQAR